MGLARVNSSNSPQSTKLLRARTSQSFDSELSEGFFEENSVTKNKPKELFSHDEKGCWKEVTHTSSSGSASSPVLLLPGEEKNGTAEVDELVARKMPVEKQKKPWKRVKSHCGRSLSMMEDSENMGSCTTTNNPSASHRDSKERGAMDRMDIQRVIKIDLNNMRWEECYQDKAKTEECDGETNEEFSDCGNNNNNDTLPMNSNNNNSNVLQIPAAVKRGSLRKTISFDEQLVRSSVEAGEAPTPGIKLDKDTEAGKRRPMTAAAKSSGTTSPFLQPAPPAPQSTKVSPWTQRTGQSTADRRSKFQKSFSIYQDSMDNGESDTEVDLPLDLSPTSELKNRESKKSLHVQPPPEISTMISLINPPPEEDLQSEIDKVALIINNVQTKIAEVEDKLKEDLLPEDTGQQVKGESKDEPSPELPEAPLAAAAAAEPAPPAVVAPSPTKSTRRPPLLKAASISCETELHVSPSPGSNKARPQTSKSRGTVSFSTTTTTRFIPSRSQSINSNQGISSSKDAAGSASPSTSSSETITSQSQASKNRKILIKKALIEINQSSINLGKKFGHIRPKTAPIPDKKAASGNTNNNNNNNNNNPTSNHHSNKRQPLKARSPSIKMPGNGRKSSTLSSKMDSRNSSSKEGSPEPEPEPSPPKVRAVPRQSSFSVSSDGLVPGFRGDYSEEDDVGKDLETSFLNSKKREECLKIYEKMMKKGCSVKLETIFRGMMTPSEYRMFLKATEMAEKNAELAEEANENVNPGDAGVSLVVPQPNT